MAGHTTDSKTAANATFSVDADDGLDASFVGPELSWKRCWSLGSIFSSECSFSCLFCPKGLASARSVDVPFVPKFANNGFDGDSFILTVFLLERLRLSRDVLRSRSRKEQSTTSGK